MTNRNDTRELLRHMLATIVFRAGIAITEAPDDFSDFRVNDEIRSPSEILAHIGDLLIGSLHLMRGDVIELRTVPLEWPAEVDRFLDSARDLDKFLATDEPLAHPVEKFVQGPLGDALTHVGQLVMLRRLAGSAVKAAPYFTAEIVAGDF